MSFNKITAFIICLCFLPNFSAFSNTGKYQITPLNARAAIMINTETGDSYISTPCTKEQAREYTQSTEMTLPFRCWIKMDLIDDWSKDEKEKFLVLGIVFITQPIAY
jgi:hypothetical protein